MISQLKDHYISVYQARYATFVVAEYLETATIKENSKFHKTTLTNDMMLTKEGASISDEKMEVLYREYSIQYKACL